MAISRRSALAVAAVTMDASTLVGLVMTPALAGGAPAAPVAVAPALAGASSATAHVDTQWSGGEIVAVKLTNTSTAAATKWAVTWTLDADQSGGQLGGLHRAGTSVDGGHCGGRTRHSTVVGVSSPQRVRQAATMQTDSRRRPARRAHRPSPT